ncbi:MAG: hypothetical protein QOG21_690 [Actinomycetota bacterium]|jgi:hypothetical protein|nr:hypothetical protein [Actinomycetota bacterium]
MKERSRLGNILTGVAVGAAVIAIRQEMSKPPSNRGWNGKVGPIPYDFRLPTPSRIRERYWNPDDDRILVPQLFGVGWTINLGRVVRLFRS